MDLARINTILNNDEKFDVFYDERPVWVQEIHETEQIAKVGFVDDFEEKDVFIKDLYERNL
ncbi:MAG: small, acid-soluble spore protein, H family [Clostridia bacterium]|nr:small, acid-soluble spore protein, H family [Clostridia bacterium]